MKTAFPDQREAIDALYKYLQQPDSGDPLVVVPTAGGKSFIMAKIMAELSAGWPGTRFLVLAHVQELVEQDYDELLEEWPEAPCGIFSAGIGRKEIDATILFASIQSLDGNIHRLDPAPDIVFVDEAHLIPRKDNTRYKEAIKLLRMMNPGVRIIGLTATPYRLDSGWLHIGEDALFSAIAYNIPVQTLIDAGRITPVVAQGTGIGIDTAGVHHSGGEFIHSELERASMADGLTARIVADIIERGEDRKKWLIFTTGAKHANEFRDELFNQGVPCDVVLGTTPKGRRKEIINEFKAGQIRVLVTAYVLTTGFNVRDIDLIADVAATESPSLYVQKIGRGMRVAPGKENCLDLDYAGNALRHGPIDAVNVRTPGMQGSGVPPAKECPGCGKIIATGFLVCPYCGHEFPPREMESKISDTPVAAPILVSQIEPRELEVDAVNFTYHEKQGRPPCVRVDYICGFSRITEWLFPESSGERNYFRLQKYMEGAGAEAIPKTAAELVDNPPPRKPVRIWVLKNGKYDDIIKREFA